MLNSSRLVTLAWYVTTPSPLYKEQEGVVLKLSFSSSAVGLALSSPVAADQPEITTVVTLPHLQPRPPILRAPSSRPWPSARPAPAPRSPASSSAPSTTACPAARARPRRPSWTTSAATRVPPCPVAPPTSTRTGPSPAGSATPPPLRRTTRSDDQMTAPARELRHSSFPLDGDSGDRSDSATTWGFG
ncbi:uncharacterized protein PG986_000048 [Apiospora aurea]|uniref:Uncharacterized protein n=1 Tax=Apiospora aurea TaxID=335848 RepID=A0ABR1QSX3_9PEZI